MELLSILALIAIIIGYMRHTADLRAEIKLQRELKHLWRHYYEIMFNEKERYKDKYLDAISRPPEKPKTVAAYKKEIIADYKNKVPFREMEAKYWIKANTIRKAIYRREV